MTGLLIVLAFLAGMCAAMFVMLLAASDTDRHTPRDTSDDWFEDVDAAILNVSQTRPVLRSVGHAKGRATEKARRAERLVYWWDRDVKR